MAATRTPWWAWTWPVLAWVVLIAAAVLGTGGLVAATAGRACLNNRRYTGKWQRSLRAIAAALNARAIPTATGTGKWEANLGRLQAWLRARQTERPTKMESAEIVAAE